MNKAEKLTFIEGAFTDEDAKDFLMNIFSTKINYHKLKNYSSQVRFGKDDATAQKRIPELKRDLEKIQQLLAEAKATNKRLMITSEINISLAEE